MVQAAVATACIGLLTACAPPVSTATTQPTTAILRSADGRNLPADLRDADFTAGYRIPAGWFVDGYGAAGDARWLAVTARRSSAVAAGGNFSWAIDRRTGVVHSYPQVEPSWYSGSAIAIHGWLFHTERQQLQAADCTAGSADDCFSWKLYAVRVGSSMEQVIAASSRPGSQERAPIPHVFNSSLAWVQGAVHGSGFDVISWSLVTHKARRLAHLPEFAGLQADGKTLVLHTSSSSSDSNPSWSARTLPHSTSDDGAYNGRYGAAIRTGTIIYLPYTETQDTSWRLGIMRDTARATASSSAALSARGADAISAQFITNQYAVVLSDESMDIIAVNRRRTVASVAADDSLSSPRVAGEDLVVVSQAGTDTRVIAWRSFAGTTTAQQAGTQPHAPSSGHDTAIIHS